MLVPLGVALAIRMIPAPVLDKRGEKTREVVDRGRPVNGEAAVVVAAWLFLAALAVLLVARWARQ